MILSNKKQNETIEIIFDTTFIESLVNIEYNQENHTVNIDLGYNVNKYSDGSDCLIMLIITSSNVFASAYRYEIDDTYEIKFTDKEKQDLFAYLLLELLKDRR